MGKDVIVACDFASKAQTLEFLDNFTGRKPFVKIGMELFYAEGPQIVREIKNRGHKIFLDLKLHDIPNQVKKAMAVLSRMDVDICNVHAAGTVRMMEAFKLPSIKKFRPERILIKPYAFWPSGHYRFDNLSLRRATKAEVDAVNAQMPSIKEVLQ